MPKCSFIRWRISYFQTFHLVVHGVTTHAFKLAIMDVNVHVRGTYRKQIVAVIMAFAQW